MANTERTLTGVERTFGEDEFIVSKTDQKGRITYANDVFIRIGGYIEAELINQPHSILRHPAMPRCVFQLLWDRIASGKEIFAYVINRAKTGDHYWVFAHVTPTVGAGGEIIGYHSNRRRPKRSANDAREPVYGDRMSVEQSVANAKEGMRLAGERLGQFLSDQEVSYDELVLSL